MTYFKGARTSSGAWAGSVANGYISETKLATGLEQSPTERPMPAQHAAANSRLQLQCMTYHKRSSGGGFFNYNDTKLLNRTFTLAVERDITIS